MLMEVEVLKDSIENKKYNESIRIIKKEIISELEKEIKLNNPRFKYTNIYNLILACEKYLTGEKKHIAKCLYTPEYLEFDEKDELIFLLENYKTLTC